MNDFKKFTGDADADDNALTIALSNIISGIIIASGFLMAALIIATSFLWGWVGFISVIGIFILTLLAFTFCGDE